MSLLFNAPSDPSLGHDSGAESLSMLLNSNIIDPRTERLSRMVSQVLQQTTTRELHALRCSKKVSQADDGLKAELNQLCVGFRVRVVVERDDDGYDTINDVPDANEEVAAALDEIRELMTSSINNALSNHSRSQFDQSSAFLEDIPEADEGRTNNEARTSAPSGSQSPSRLVQYRRNGARAFDELRSVLQQRRTELVPDEPAHSEEDVNDEADAPEGLSDLELLRQRRPVSSVHSEFRQRIEAVLSARMEGAAMPRPRANTHTRNHGSSSEPSSQDSFVHVRRPSSDSTESSSQRPSLGYHHRRPSYDQLSEALSEASREDNLLPPANDVEDLVRLQVVSDILSGHFRGRLERMLQAHQTNRSPNQQPRRRPNNARHHEPPQQHYAPPPQQSAFQSRISSARERQLNDSLMRMKEEMVELRAMVAASLDVQLDVQRAMRQEVAAALRQQLGASPQSHFVPQHTVPLDGSACAVCLDKKSDSVLYRCGHMCACHMCALKLMQTGQPCPLCRAPVDDVIRVYGFTPAAAGHHNTHHNPPPAPPLPVTAAAPPPPLHRAPPAQPPRRADEADNSLVRALMQRRGSITGGRIDCE